MRLFKHGQSFAIVIPDNICKKLRLSEATDLEFFEAEDGLLLLATRELLSQKLKKVIQPLITAIIPDLLTFSTEQDALIASKKLEPQIRKNEVLAAFGSDRKYYLISATLYAKVADKLFPCLGVEKTMPQLATETALPLKELVPVVAILKEKGEVIEKSKGKYLLVK